MGDKVCNVDDIWNREKKASGSNRFEKVLFNVIELHLNLSFFIRLVITE